MILTLIALFVVLAGGACLLIYHLKKYYSEGWSGTAFILLLIGGICLLLCIIFISIKEVEAKAYIVKIEAVRETFQIVRLNQEIHPLELAAIQQKAIEKNEWIANAKFWAGHPLTNWFWSKRILEIKPIK